MIYVAFILAAVIVFLVWQSTRERATHDATIKDLITEAVAERAELLTRIQRPEFVIPPRSTPIQQAPPPRDAVNLAKIGTIAAEASNGD